MAGFASWNTRHTLAPLSQRIGCHHQNSCIHGVAAASTPTVGPSFCEELPVNYNGRQESPAQKNRGPELRDRSGHQGAKPKRRGSDAKATEPLGKLIPGKSTSASPAQG